MRTHFEDANDFLTDAWEVVISDEMPVPGYSEIYIRDFTFSDQGIQQPFSSPQTEALSLYYS
jgi:hypothetical protein